MTTHEIIGVVITIGVPLIVSVASLLKPIVNLNTSITKLGVVMDRVIQDINRHDKELKDHEKRLYSIEKDK